MTNWKPSYLYRPGHRVNKVFSPRHQPPLPRKNICGTHFYLRLSNPEAIVRPEGLCQWKIPGTLSGIEPATFKLLVQCLHHAIACPYVYVITWNLWVPILRGKIREDFISHFISEICVTCRRYWWFSCRIHGRYSPRWSFWKSQIKAS